MIRKLIDEFFGPDVATGQDMFAFVEKKIREDELQTCIDLINRHRQSMWDAFLRLGDSDKAQTVSSTASDIAGLLQDRKEEL